MYFSSKFYINRIIHTLKSISARHYCSLIEEKCSLESLTERGLLRIHGKEASNFLQGLITNDMRHLEEASSMYTMFLNIKGRVMCDSIIYKHKENTFLVESDKDILPSLQKHLKMYRVRKKIDIDLFEELKIWVLYLKSHLMQNKTDTQRRIDPEEIDGVSRIFQQSEIVCPDPRLAELGYRLIVNEDFLKSSTFQGNEMIGKEYKQLRYKMGVGEGIIEMPPGKCFPLELNCDFLHGVSFHKGCYVGQELTARIYHTGVIRKRLMPIVLESTAKNLFTIDAKIESVCNSKVIGKLCGLEKEYGLGLMKVADALSSQTIYVLNTYGSTWRPNWWPQESIKERIPTDKTEIKPL